MHSVKKQSIFKYAVVAYILSMLSLLVFIDKDDGDKTTIALEDGSRIVLEKGVAFQRHFAQFTPPPLLSQFFTPQKTN
jgi:hypothetical protein